MARKRFGPLVKNWSPLILPIHQKMAGRYVHLKLLSAQKLAADLYQAYRDHDSVWDYMSTGP